jgi:hypothetical protein
MTHDASLDQRMLSVELTPAERLAKEQGTGDLNCNSLSAKEISSMKSEGAPMGPVWSCYDIQVSGCGKVRKYEIQCQDGGGCIVPE